MIEKHIPRKYMDFFFRQEKKSFKKSRIRQNAIQCTTSKESCYSTGNKRQSCSASYQLHHKPPFELYRVNMVEGCYLKLRLSNKQLNILVKGRYTEHTSSHISSWLYEQGCGTGPRVWTAELSP